MIRPCRRIDKDLNHRDHATQGYWGKACSQSEKEEHRKSQFIEHGHARCYGRSQYRDFVLVGDVMPLFGRKYQIFQSRNLHAAPVLAVRSLRSPCTIAHQFLSPCRQSRSIWRLLCQKRFLFRLVSPRLTCERWPGSLTRSLLKPVSIFKRRPPDRKSTSLN